MPKLRRRREKNERYRKLTDADNGLKVTKGISEAFKKSKPPRSDVNPNPPNPGTDDAAEEVSPVKTQQEIDEILRQFDLDWRFGPSIGITRLQRWSRAEKLGQRPPEEVKEILSSEPQDSHINQCLWSKYKLI